MTPIRLFSLSSGTIRRVRIPPDSTPATTNGSRLAYASSFLISLTPDRQRRAHRTRPQPAAELNVIKVARHDLARRGRGILSDRSRPSDRPQPENDARLALGFNENRVRLKSVPVNGIQELAEIPMIRKSHPLQRLIDRIKQRLIVA